MRIKNIPFLTFLTFTLLFSVIRGINLNTVTATSTPTVAVVPEFVPIMNINETFTLNVTVTDAESMYGVGIDGVEIRLEYDPTILEATNLTEGPFLRSFGETFIMQSNITDGRVWFTDVLLTPVGQGATGSGVLLTVNFTVTGTGVSPLYLTPYNPTTDMGTHLVDSYLDARGQTLTLTHVIVPAYVDGIYGSPITISISQTKIKVGENITISGSLVEGAGPDVSLYYRHTGETAWISLANVTAVNGAYSYVWVKPDAGSYDIKGVTTYLGETLDSLPRSFTVEAPGLDVLTIVAIVFVVVIVVIVVAVVYFKKIRKKEEETESE